MSFSFGRNVNVTNFFPTHHTTREAVEINMPHDSEWSWYNILEKRIECCHSPRHVFYLTFCIGHSGRSSFQMNVSDTASICDTQLQDIVRFSQLHNKQAGNAGKTLAIYPRSVPDFVNSIMSSNCSECGAVWFWCGFCSRSHFLVFCRERMLL